MNLKEAFRYQNKLQSMMLEAEAILGREQNITKVKNTHLRSKVMPEAADETTVDMPSTEYSEHITQLAEFLLFLLDEREKLSVAIYKAKATLDLPAGLDGEVGLNSKRQEVAALFRRMSGIRSSEALIANGGTGYRFNNEGNQVTYRCDVKKVVTINFDRNRIRRLCSDLSNQADEISGQIDAAMVNTQVDYSPTFAVSESFADVFEAFLWEQTEP